MTDCNGKGLPREAATGRWNGMQGRLDRESDWKWEWESVNGIVKGKLQKTGAGRDCNWGSFCFWGCKFNYGKKAVVTTRWLWGSGNNGYGSNCTGGGDQ